MSVKKNNPANTPPPLFPPEVLNLAQHVGNFIQYWGFNKLHGQLWCLIYLSQQPLSGQDLARELNMSKASISLAIKDLVFYEVIIPIKRGIRNTLYYESNPDIIEVIIGILKYRELTLLKHNLQAMNNLKEALLLSSQSDHSSTFRALNLDHVKQLDHMIQKAHSFLEFLIESRLISSETMIK